MYMGSYRQAFTVALVIALSVGTLGVASAGDLGKYLLGAAVGVLAYKAIESDNCYDRYDSRCAPVPYVRAEQPWDRNPRYSPPPNYGYYAPSPRQAYDQGYGDGWKDGKQYGERRGFARGYDRGYDRGRSDDRWVVTRRGGCY